MINSKYSRQGKDVWAVNLSLLVYLVLRCTLELIKHTHYSEDHPERFA